MADLATVIGHRIANRRKERKLTQTALAAAVGVTQAYIAKIEGGGSVPPTALLEQIAGALGTTTGPLIADMPLTETDRDDKCRELAIAASSNVFAQAGLTIAMGCIPGCKPANKAEAIELVGQYDAEYGFEKEPLAAILSMLKRGE